VTAWLMLLPVALAALELLHPVAPGAEGAAWWGWIPLHLGLLVGYTALAWLLWRVACGRFMRGALAAFGAVNTVYLLTDGVAVGVLGRANPADAQVLWASPLVSVLADASGAIWAAALLLLAAADAPRPVKAVCALTWLAFVASAQPVGLPIVAGRALALASGAALVYAQGARCIPAALVIFSAVLRQHVGPEAALGLLLLAPVLSARGRSSPAAASPP
jgi:hypothetical protein